MTEQEYSSLPRAFHAILQDHPGAMGIFQAMPSYYGPGASAIQEPYEVLAAAALMTECWSTSLGKSFVISRGDEVDFGLKLAKGSAQPKRYGTIELDIVVHRGFDCVVGIDAKHAHGGEYNSTEHLSRQLAGIRTGFNDGKIQEFYYVTNGQFGSAFIRLVDQTNLDLVKDWVGHINEMHVGPGAPMPVTSLSAEERATLPRECIDPDALMPDGRDTKALAEKYHVPQIGLCEHVVFHG
jgi:hypothetical protein